MISQLTSYLFTIFDQVFSWIKDLYSSVGLTFVSIAIGFFAVAAIFKFILSPYLSAAGSSDSARSRRGKH